MQFKTCQSGGSVEKPSLLALVFKYFRHVKQWAKHLLWLLLQGSESTIAMITPMRQARTCGQVLALGPTPSASKQWKSDVHV